MARKTLMNQRAASRIQSAEARQSLTGGVSKKSFAARAARAAARNSRDIESLINHPVHPRGCRCKCRCCCCYGLLKFLLLVSLVVAALVAWKHPEEVKSVIISFQSALQNFAHKVQASNTWHEIVSFFSHLADQISNLLPVIWHEIASFFSHLADQISNLFPDIWHGIVSVFSHLVDIISSLFEGIWRIIVAVITFIPNSIEAFFHRFMLKVASI